MLDKISQLAEQVARIVSRRKLLCLSLAVIVTTLGIADDGQRGRRMLIDNFNDGDHEGWTELDFTTPGDGGPAIYDASSGALRVRSAGAIPITDPAAGAMNASWEASRIEPKFGNGVVRGTVRANTEETTAGYLLRANTDPGSDHDYGFFGSSSFGTFYIERFDLNAASPQTILAMADPDEHPFVAGIDYWFEAGVQDDRIWMRAWPVGARRPGRPTLVVRDDTFGPEDGTLLSVLAFFDPAAVGADAIHVDATFDDITFKPLRPRNDNEQNEADDDAREED